MARSSGNPGSKEVARGLEGVIESDSSITLLDGASNKLYYRGYDVTELARHSTFEDVAELLWTGELPTLSQRNTLLHRLVPMRKCPPGLRTFLPQIPKDMAPLDALRTAMSALSPHDAPSPGADGAAQREMAERLTSLAPTLITDLVRLGKGMPPLDPDPSLSHSEDFLRRLTGSIRSREENRVFESVLVLHADHEMNTSTFAARVAASTSADMVSGVTSAIATLKGPLHGGAGEQVMEMVESIGKPEDADRFIRAKLERRERIMGFGHRVYRGEDPRATVLRELSRERAERTGDSRIHDILTEVERSVRKHRGLFPNVDLYSGSIYHSLGIPRELHGSIFAAARMPGWTAHIMEEYADLRLICPQARYVGRPPRRLPEDRTEVVAKSR